MVGTTDQCDATGSECIVGWVFNTQGGGSFWPSETLPQPTLLASCGPP
jgi:hypothetical protein